MNNYCPFCNGDIETNADNVEECVLCGTTFKKCSKERAMQISRQNEIRECQQLSKEVWGR